MANRYLDTSIVDKAVVFAVRAHSNTERRGKGYPYVFHPLEAMCIVATLTTDQELLAAAVLHDTVEDTPTTFEEVLREFGPRVAELVKVESTIVTGDVTWHERKQQTADRIAQASRDAKIVAMGDKLSNLRTIAADYSVIGEEVWKRFSAPGGKSDIAWYYRTLATALSALSDTPAYQEYLTLLDQTFGQ